MNLVNLLKILALKLSDVINSAVEYFVFDELTRPCSPKDNEKLYYKASLFEQDFIIHFKEFGGNIWNYHLSDPLDSGDQALWHGVYTYYWALKYSVKPAEEGLLRMHSALAGLHMHQMDGREPVRRLVRGFDRSLNFRDDASNDSLTGHLLGIFGLWRYGDIVCQHHAQVLAAGIADELLRNNYALVNADGSVTKYGQLIDGWKTDPLRASLALAVFKLAAVSAAQMAMNTDDTEERPKLRAQEFKYSAVYKELSRTYGPLVKYAKAKLLWIEKTYDTHRAAIHLYILAELETDSQLLKTYKGGLSRIYRIARKTGNAWILFLICQHVEISSKDIANCLKLLREFSFTDKTTVTEKDYSSKYSTVKWGSERLAKQPIPTHEMTSQDFIWQRQLRSVKGREGYTGSKEHNGIDFNLPYYLARRYNLISEDD